MSILSLRVRPFGNSVQRIAFRSGPRCFGRPDGNQPRSLIARYSLALLALSLLLPNFAFALTPTTTSLTVTPASSAAPGTVATLTASVKESSGNTVSAGTILFYDSFFPTLPIAQAQITPAGTASVRTVLAVGTHGFTARFVATVNDAASTSSTQTVVSPASQTYSTSSTITQDTSNGDSITAALTLNGYGAPTGAVQVQSLDSGAILGTSPIKTTGFHLNLPRAFPATAQTVALVAADFNNDGLPDLAAVENTGQVAVFINGGGGAFAPPVEYMVGNGPAAIVVGDFNADGIPDLAVTNMADNTVSLLRGIGDGTFMAAITLATGSAPLGIVVSDLNRDGKLDLLVVDSGSVDNNGDSQLEIFNGNGDGTFAATSTKILLFPGSQYAAVGDLNSDGVLDVAVTQKASTIEVLLGKSDGTFAPGATLFGGYPMGQIVIADMNNDGIQDLVANTGDIYTYVFPGKGDGTFPTKSQFSTSSGSAAMVVADFNHDGILDIGISNNKVQSIFNTSLVDVYLGQVVGGVYSVSSGTTEAIASVAYPVGIVAADFNGDGLLDVAAAGQAFEIDVNLAYLTASGSVPNVTILQEDHLTGTYLPGPADPYAGSVSKTLTVEPPALYYSLAFDGNPPSLSYTAGSTPMPLTVIVLDNFSDRNSTAAFPVTLSVTGPNGVTSIYKQTTVNGATTFTLPAYVTAGTYNISAHTDSALGNSDPKVTLTVTAGPQTPTNLFISSPYPLHASRGVASGVTLAVLDQNGNPDVAFTGTVTLATTDPAATSTPVAHTFVAADLGVYTFQLAFNTAGTQTLTFSSAGLSPVTESRIAVLPPSATTLSYSATPVPSLATVALQATVTVAGKPVVRGTVNFFDAAAVPQLIATVQLNGSGVASVNEILGVGTHPITAVFTGTSAAGASTSPAQTLTVTPGGNYVSTNLIGGGSGTYSLGDGVGFIGRATPTGTINYVDLNHNSLVLATERLSSSSFSFTVNTLDTPVGIAPYLMVKGDFNGDGVPDLAVVNSNATDNTVSVLIGNLYGGAAINPDGTVGTGSAYQQPLIYAVGHRPIGIAVGDFNADGKQDLAVANSGDNTVSVLLGNGDGSFQPALTFAVGNTPIGLAAGDVDGDGFLDLLVTNSGDSTLSLLRGKGDGTFAAQTTIPTGAGPQNVVLADFNGDGALDFAVTNGLANSVLTMLGNGDGTFYSAQTLAGGAFPYALLALDVAATGKISLAATNLNGSSVSFYKGNGDGTFASPATLTTGSMPVSMAAADFYNNGVLDLAVADAGDKTGTVFLYFGDTKGNLGLYGGSTIDPIGPNPQGIVAADTSTDGLQSLVVSGKSQSNQYNGLNSRPAISVLPVLQLRQAPAGLGAVGLNDADDHIVSAQYVPGPSDPYSGSISSSVSVPGLLLQTAGLSQTPSGPFTAGVVPAAIQLQAEQGGALNTSYTGPLTLMVTGLDITYLQTYTRNAIAGKAAIAIPAFTQAGTYRFYLKLGTGGYHFINGTDTLVVAAPAARLLVSTPFITPAARGVSGAVGVTVADAFGNTVTTYTGTVTLTTSDTAAIVRPLSHTFVSNDAGFTSFAVTFNTSGAESITASAASLTSAIQPNITVIAPQLTTTTTLAFGPASPQPAKTPVTLTATVLDSTGTPVALGLVNFYDSAASPNLIASAPLSAAGVATVKFNFAVGTHGINATFQPKNADQGSTSGVQTLVITPAANYLTQTALGFTGAPASYTLNATLGALGVVPPTGQLSFLDTSNGNARIGSATLGTGSSAFAPQVTYPTGFTPGDTLQADFNGDGRPDLAILNTNDGTISILAGNGDGTFATATAVTLGLYSATRMAAGDFNSDGRLDLAVVDQNGQLAILLGNGDATFKPANIIGGLTNALGGLNDTGLSGLVLGDFNRDGKLDVAISNLVDGTVLVLLGYGDGTFQNPVFYAGETGPQGLAVADLNGDGYPDLVVANSLGNTVSVLLGNGDGTFGNQAAFAVGQQPTAVAVADFNGDGKIDVIATNESTGNVSVLLGKGDGTFQAAINTVSGHGPTNIITGDFDVDGRQDAVVVNQFDNTAALLLGKGDGTFGAALPFTTGAAPAGLAAGDFTSSGRLSLAVANSADNTVSILLGEELYPAPLAGVTFPGSGLHAVKAVYNTGTGDAYSSSTSALINLYGNGTPIPTVAVSSSKNPSTLGVAFTLTATLTSTTAGTITGTVSFYDGTTLLGTGTAAGGTASFSTSTLALGVHTITAVYSGNSAYANASSAAFTEVVGAVATTTTAVASSLSPAVIGQGVTFTASVQSTVAGTPTGTVTFLSDGMSIGTGTLNGSGIATFSTSALTVGTHSVQAVYGSDPTYQPSTSPAITQSIVKQLSTTRVAASTSTIENNGTVTFTATVTGTAGTPTGSVAFTDGTFVFATVALNSAGVATTSSYIYVIGAHNIAATYLGNATYGGSASPAIVVTNGLAPKTSVTTIASSATYVLDASGVTLNLAVTGSDGGVPTGTVSVSTGYNSAVFGTLDSTGKVTIPLPTVNSGPNSFTATYSGDLTYQASTSLPLIVYGTDAVNDPILILKLSKIPGVSGQPEIFTVSVHSVSGATPTGTVTLTDQLGFNPKTTLSTLTLNASGVATFTTSALNVSPFHEVYATYNGDSIYTAGAQDYAYFEVTQGPTQPTTTTVTINPNPSPVGGPVTLTALVTSQLALLPTGSVTFYDGTRLLSTQSLNGSAVATFTIASLPSGSHTISAAYDGDNFYASSVGFGALALTVGTGRTATATMLGSSLNPSRSGQSVTFTANVAGTGGTPSGSVTFSDGTATLATVNLSGGSASFTTSSLSVASHSITASYSGDNSFATSVSAALPQVVTQAVSPTVTTLAASPNPAGAGQSITLTATVAATSSGAGTPGGTVTFLDGQSTLGTGTVNAGGIATLPVTLAVGPHSLSASYAAAANYNASTSSTLPVVVSKAASGIALTSSAPSVTAGSSVTFTVTVTSSYSGTPGGTLTPGGTVTFSDGAATLATGTLNSAGVATFSTSTLPVGTHSISAVYGADTTFAASTSNTLAQLITQATTPPTSTVLSVSPNPALVLQTITLSATVTSTGTGAITGGVSFFDGSTVLGQGTLSAGVATFSTTLLTAGTHTLTASYAGTASFNPSTSTAISETINKVTSTATLTSSLNPGVSGQSVTFTATVTPVSSGAPTGTVSFSDGATLLGTAALNNAGVATFTTSSLSVASHSITAAYSGDATYTTSMANPFTETVTQATTPATATALAVSPNPAFVLQTVTLTAPVTSTTSGTIAGSVNFLDGSTLLGQSSLSNGVATFTTAGLTAGPHSLTASYVGTASFSSSTSNIVPETINKIASTASLVSSLNPSLTGQSVTFTATVAPVSSGTPTGSITFSDGGTLLATVALNASATATYTTSALLAASHPITAAYTGDSNYAASTSPVLTEVVSKTPLVAAAVAALSSANPASTLQPILFTAMVTSTSPGTPSGSVSFLDGATLLGTATLNAAAVATFSTASLSAGSHTITALYNGDNTFNQATSAAFTQVVNKLATTSTLSTSLTPSPLAQPVTFTASVKPSQAGIPTGSVTFLDGATTLGTATVNASGAAVFTTTALTTGTHNITAVYGSDPNYAGSISAALVEVISATATTTALTTTPNPSGAGQAVGFTATVTASAGIPAGSVNFLDGAVVLGSGPLNGAGVAAFSSATLVPGIHSLTATYLPSGGLVTSTSSAVIQAVNKAASATAFTVSAASAYTGQPVVLTATLSSAFAGVPTGAVSFFDGATPLGNATVGTSSTATLSTSALAVGVHTLSASYAGDATYLASTSTSSSITILADFTLSAATSTQVVNPGFPATYNISAAPAGGSYNGLVTFSITGLPSGASATFSPASLTPGSGPAVSILTINTAGLVAADRPAPRFPGVPRLPLYAAALLLPLAGLRRSREALRRCGRSTLPRALLLLLAALAATSAVSGCGSGGFFAQPAKSYSLTVTGTAGALQHSAALTLTVQ